MKTKVPTRLFLLASVTAVLSLFFLPPQRIVPRFPSLASGA